MRDQAHKCSACKFGNRFARKYRIIGCDEYERRTGWMVRLGTRGAVPARRANPRTGWRNQARPLLSIRRSKRVENDPGKEPSGLIRRRVTRRSLLSGAVLLTGAALLEACTSAATPAPAPSPTQPAAAAASPTKAAAAAPTVAPTTAPANTPAAGKALKVGLVTDVGKIDDKAFNQSAWEGVQQVQKELGARRQVHRDDRPEGLPEEHRPICRRRTMT